MAYAIQSAVCNLAANFFEPYVNYRVQKHYAKHSPSHPGAGNYTQNLAGEFAGDIIGASTLILAEALFPEQLHTCTRTIRRGVDPLYTTVAHRVFDSEYNSPDYAQKVENWKLFQERNLVRSAIIATAGIAGNVVTQKLVIGNPSPTKLIFAGKLVSTTLTTALGLAARLAFPRQIKGMDSWISKSFLVPIMEDREKTNDVPIPASHVERLKKKDESTLLLNGREWR